MKEILVQEGEVAKVGEDLCIIEVDEEVSDEETPSSELARPPPRQVQETIDSADHASSSDGVSSPPQIQGDDFRPSEPRRPHPLDPNHAEQVFVKNTKDVLALPAVRHFARLSGVDLSLLAPGSGKNGRIEKSDVEGYLSRGKQAAGTQTRARGAVSLEEDVVVELGRTRYGMWKAMTKVSSSTISVSSGSSLESSESGDTSFRVSMIRLVSWLITDSFVAIQLI